MLAERRCSLVEDLPPLELMNAAAAETSISRVGSLRSKACVSHVPSLGELTLRLAHLLLAISAQELERH